MIRTAAVHDENPEIAAARAAGIPVFERAQAWGAIMRGYKNALCIACLLYTSISICSFALSSHKKKENPTSNNYNAQNAHKDTIPALSEYVIDKASGAVWSFSIRACDPPPVKNCSQQCQPTARNHHILPVVF